LTLQVRQLRLKALDGLPIFDEAVMLDKRKQAKDLFRSRAFALPLFWVDR